MNEERMQMQSSPQKAPGFFLMLPDIWVKTVVIKRAQFPKAGDPRRSPWPTQCKQRIKLFSDLHVCMFQVPAPTHICTNIECNKSILKVGQIYIPTVTCFWDTVLFWLSTDPRSMTHNSWAWPTLGKHCSDTDWGGAAVHTWPHRTQTPEGWGPECSMSHEQNCLVMSLRSLRSALPLQRLLNRVQMCASCHYRTQCPDKWYKQGRSLCHKIL